MILAPSRGSGLMGQMAATAGGVAVGSVVGAGLSQVSYLLRKYSIRNKWDHIKNSLRMYGVNWMPINIGYNSDRWDHFPNCNYNFSNIYNKL